MIGNIEIANSKEISGWSTSKNIIIIINNKFEIKPRITDLRTDCIESGYLNARGIYLKISRYLEKGINRIKVIDKNSDSIINNGEIEVIYDPDKVVDAHWSGMYENNSLILSRWWQSEIIVNHVCKKICNEDVTDLIEALNISIKKKFLEKIPFKQAISVGSGQGMSEIKMVEAGIVDKFELYELSSLAVTNGNKLVQEKGISEKVQFIHGNAFEICQKKDFCDLVFWKQALHHMSDTDAAIEWSYSVLKPGGAIVLDEYMGPTRFQFSNEILQINTKLRKSLDNRFLVNPWTKDSLLETSVSNTDIDDLIAIDPSEAADSGNIIPSLKKHFPEIEIIPTGGMIYHCALNDIIHNLIEENASSVINLALALDDLLARLGETQYAVAFGIKK
jgi:ubiquinone/menaquinone biosynthesis C-methylase UbiE